MSVRGGGLQRVVAIFIKDLKSYYSKAPVISWGILFPLTVIALLDLSARMLGEYRVVPAMLSITMLFASTSMSQVAVSFEKLSGAMQRVLYMPVGSAELVVAKSLGGIIYGIGGTGLAGILAYIMTGHVAMIRPAYFLAGVVLGSTLYSALSVLVSLYYNPVQAVAVLNIIRFSMIFLGGTLFPKALLPRILAGLAYFFPSVYITDLLRFGMYNTWEYVDPLTSLIVTAILLAATLYIAHRLALKVMLP